MYDYVIVGAGSAGCVLAARLSEDPDVNVLLLEAGPPDTNENIHVPLGYLQLARTELDWDYRTAPEANCNGRQLALPRGKVLGGSSSVNAMVYIRGNRADYDGWGVPGWGWDELFPYFLKSEDNERGASDWHAAGGPLPVSDQRSGNVITPAFVEAGVEAGPGPERGLQRPRAGRGRDVPGDPARRHARQRRRRLPAPRDGAAEPDGDALHAGRPDPLRRRPSDRSRRLPDGPGAGASGRAGNDPLRRQLQLSAAADALRRRTGRTPGDARNRAAGRPAGSWREPLRPRCQLRGLDDPAAG